MLRRKSSGLSRRHVSVVIAKRSPGRFDGSDSSWQQRDPQLPKSVWYLTDAPWLGIRIVRPVEVPTVEEMYFYWNSSTGKN